MLLLEIFVGEFLAVNRLATSALDRESQLSLCPCCTRSGDTHIATGEVAALEHELGNHAMELGASVTKTLFASAQGAEVLGGLGGGLVVEVEIDTAGLVCDEIRHGHSGI